jgi:hypothetical protein
MGSIKLFISGRVTGLPRAEAIRNFERGRRLCMQNTYLCVNPMDVVPEGSTNKEAMRILLPLLMECDGILLLNDTKFSEGSQVKEAVARYCGLQMFYEDDLTQ